MLAPVPLQTVCVRHEPPGLEGEALDAHTRAWRERVNPSGAAYLTAAVLDGRWMVRVAIGAPTPSARTSRRRGRGDAGPCRGQRRIAGSVSDRPRMTRTLRAWSSTTLRGLIAESDPTRARARHRPGPVADARPGHRQPGARRAGPPPRAGGRRRAAARRCSPRPRRRARSRPRSTPRAQARRRARRAARARSRPATGRSRGGVCGRRPRPRRRPRRRSSHALRWQAEHGADRVHIVLREETGEERRSPTAACIATARAVAAGLRGRGVAPGERVALLLRTERAFFDAYFGILLAGGVPVPLYPPFRADQIEEYAARQAGILRNAERPRPADVRRGATRRRAAAPAGARRSPTSLTVPDEVATRAGRRRQLVDAGRGDAISALIQYTSGSTGSPKGVALSHANLLANIRAFGEAFDVTRRRRRRDVAAAVPRHGADRRVVRAALPRRADRLDVAARVPGEAGALAPGVLTRIAARSRAAPNFAYDLCARKIADDEIGRHRPDVVALRAQRRRSGDRRHDRALHDALRPVRLPRPRR